MHKRTTETTKSLWIQLQSNKNLKNKTHTPPTQNDINNKNKIPQTNPKQQQQKKQPKTPTPKKDCFSS